jgi:hypothetical protein
MSSELSRTIATGFVWASVAVILTFGVCRDGMDVPQVAATLIIVIGATISSVAIWIPMAFLGKKAEARGFEVVQPAEKLDRE